MSVMKTDSEREVARRHAKQAALVLSLVGSAYIMGAVIPSGEYSWLRWLALLPLLATIRVCRPHEAMLCGVLWGLTLCTFSVAAGGAGFIPSVWSLALAGAIPAFYTGAGAWLTRRIGFSPFVLGVAWMGVEVACEPLGLRSGLLAGAWSDGIVLHWVGSALGYVLAAFVVAYVSAWLLSAVTRVRIVIPPPRPAAESRENGTLLVPQTFSCFPLLAIPPSQPRAPPRHRPVIGSMSLVRCCG